MPFENQSFIGKMNRSTIYKRHERRRLTSMKNADDPRPKAVRVLAGLPGFRLLMTPPAQLQRQEHSSSSFDTENDSTIFESSTSSSSSSTLQQEQAQAQKRNTPIMEFSSLGQPLAVVFAAGVAGAMAEALYGSTAGKGSTRAQSPFAVVKSANRAAAAPLVQDLTIFRVHAAMSPTPTTSSSVQHSPASSAAFGAASKAQLLAGVSTASALFGTKAFVSRVLVPERSKADNNPLAVASLVSSATAGAMVAAVTSLQSTKARFLLSPTVTPTTTTTTTLLSPNLPRHMMGATLYFSSFETLKSYLSSNTSSSQKTSLPTVAISGAMAGTLYQTALVHGQEPATTPAMNRRAISWMASTTTATTTTQRLMVPTCTPTILRAAPAHVLLFVAYEWVQGNL